MPWPKADVMEKRIEFIVRARQAGANFSALCREYGVSRPTGYRWLQRYEEVGRFARLQEHSRRPHRSPNRTPDEVEARVLEERERWGDGAKKIRVYLEKEGLKVPWITIHRILQRHGRVETPAADRSATRRFERGEPNELWQMDFKGEYPLLQGWCHPLSILDDHSRFAVGLYALDNQRGEEVWRCLVRTFEAYGVPRAMLMDHGTPWWSMTNGHGLTGLAVNLIKQGVRLYYGRIRHPQTQGKVERFHRSLKRAARHRGHPALLEEWQILLDDFRDRYNRVRPHEALKMIPPTERFAPSARAYNPAPPEWEYPEGGALTKITASGWMTYQGHSAFVCEALAGEWVQVLEVGEALLVRYRHLFIREIDRRAGTSRPLVLNDQALNPPSVEGADGKAAGSLPAKQD